VDGGSLSVVKRRTFSLVVGYKKLYEFLLLSFYCVVKRKLPFAVGLIYLICKLSSMLGHVL
jgi:hypothetical protein